MGARRSAITLGMLLAVASVILIGAGPGAGANAPQEMSIACAAKANGLMRYATSASQCKKTEVVVAIKPGPVFVCVQTQDNNTVRLSASPSCSPRSAFSLTLPPASGNVFFCAARSSNVIRYVTALSRCSSSETPLFVLPSDAAPSVSSTSPANGDDHISPGTNITVTFSESVTAPQSAFTLVCGTSTQAFTASGSPGAVITLDPTADLPQGASCTVTVLAGSVNDTDMVDPPDTMAANYSFSFTIDGPPAVTTTSPADGATLVDPATDITVNFDEPVTVGISSFTLSCGASQAFTVAGSGTASITLHPTAALPSLSTCTVGVVAANVSDTDSADPPDHPVANTTFSFTTRDAAPAVINTTPSDGAVGVSRYADILVNFSEQVTASDGAFTLVCGTSQVITVSTSPATTFTLDPDAAIPAGPCTVTVVATKVADTDGSDPPDNMAADYTFSFTVAANQAPTDIALTPSSVDENLPKGTAVGTLTTVDADSGEAFTYSFASGGADNGSFTIVGDELATAAMFDFEAQSSYSIKVMSTDSGSLTVEKQLTVTVNNVNEAPTDISLDGTSIDENRLSGTTVGMLSASDPDAGQTHAFSTVTSGCGGSFPDSSAFSAAGSALQSAAKLNFEAKSSYTICVRTTDSGAPPLSFDESFTITVNDVNDPPSAGADSYTGAIGNTRAVVGTTGTGPQVVLTGNVLTSNDTDEDLPAQTLSAVSETVSSARGGSATIGTDGSFTFLPAKGDKDRDDTFTYHVTDGTATSAGMVTVHIDDFLVWYVDNASSAATHDGRSASPVLDLSSLNGAGGANDADGPDEVIFLNQGSGSYGGGIALEAGQRLVGEKAGLVVNGHTLVAAGSTAPVITNSGGVGVGLADGADVEGVTISGTSGDGIHGTAVTTVTVGTSSPVSVVNSGGDGIELSGAASGTVNIGAAISGSAGHSVSVANRNGGTVAFTGSVSDTGTGISLTSNFNTTINFSGGLTASTGANAAFTATGGGTINVTGSNNTLATTTAPALQMTDTTIGFSHLNFKSIAVTGNGTSPVNGIVLNGTGTIGHLAVAGGGSTSQGGDFTGGTIQNTGGAGISLTSTDGSSFNNMRVMNTSGPGIAGTDVTGFTFTNGTISGSGTTSQGKFDSNIAFNAEGDTIDNVDGTVTIVNNVLSTAYQFGVDVLNNSGTLADLNLSNNAITSTTSTASSKGSGIRVQALGSASGAASITKGELNGNTIANFPSGAGIVVSGGNVSSASAPAGNFGTNSTAGLFKIDNNVIHGESALNPMNTNCVLVTMGGRGTGFVEVFANGNAAFPLAFNKGNCLSINAFGAYQLTAAVNNNVVKPQSQLSGTFGIAGGTDQETLGDGSVADSAVLNLTANSNAVSDTTGVGMFFLANGHGTLNAKIQNNTVAAPTDSGVARPAIGVNSGSGATTDSTVCVNVSGNAAVGQTNGSFTFDGIAFRKEGTDPATNSFGIVGLSPNPATDTDMQTYVRSQNAADTQGDGGAFINDHGSTAVWTACTLTF